MSATIKRTDEHRPSVIRPEDYRFVTCLYLGGGDLGAIMENRAARERIGADMKVTGGNWSNHDHGGTCHICGAHALYVAVYYHTPSNTYIECGEDCALKMDLGDTEAFNPLRRAVQNAREAIAGKNKAKAILADNDLMLAWEYYLLDERQSQFYEAHQIEKMAEYNLVRPFNTDDGVRYCPTRDYGVLLNIVGKLVKYGNISDKQVAYLKTLLEQIKNAGVIAAKRAEEKASAEDCPEGRVEICGHIVKYALNDTNFGTVAKITVKDLRGFLVWGTCPPSSGIYKENAVGKAVSFVATVTVSDSDKKFGFYKRPAKFEVVEDK